MTTQGPFHDESGLRSGEAGGVFDYDAALPLDVDCKGTSRTAGVVVYDLTYPSPCGGRVPAFLVVPADRAERRQRGEDTLAGVVFVHPGQGNRTTFLEEAMTLAPTGAACLLPDAPFLRPESAGTADSGARRSVEEAAARDALVFTQLVVDVRRGLDLLCEAHALEDAGIGPVVVDPDRLGYVGHSLGATIGGALAVSERRLRALVLMAGYPSLTDAYRHNPHPALARVRQSLSGENLEKYLARLAPIDADRYIRREHRRHSCSSSRLRTSLLPWGKLSGTFASRASPRRSVGTRRTISLAARRRPGATEPVGSRRSWDSVSAPQTTRVAAVSSGARRPSAAPG